MLDDLNDPSDGVYFWCADALIIYKELSCLDPQDTEAWKYYYELLL